MYQLLSGAHYRTSPLDLRRMMDAPGQAFRCARAGGAVAGALWLVAEGGLSRELSRAVWAGFRGRAGIWSPSRWRRTAAVPGGDAARAAGQSDRCPSHPPAGRPGAEDDRRYRRRCRWL
ncbi:hypothetical protein NX009_11405 [Klebsiella pneumoniae]|nr:hypothetical protein [Klebsiella pneumoniae]